MRIGLVALSAKPLHAGHWGLIQLASNETDKVKLFVSLSDRKRPGEMPLLASDMAVIWRQYIEPELPTSVEVTYGGQPVRHVYEVLGDANESGSKDVFVIFSDPEDMAQNYPESSLKKYADELANGGQLELRVVNRTSTVNVSGTKMRQFIAAGDEANFLANMPAEINGKAVWKILRKTAKQFEKKKNEALLRDFVRLIDC
jgi:hypothetical protein